MSLSGMLVAVLLASSLLWIAIRDHRRRRSARLDLLNDCVLLFDIHTLHHDGDGFPRITGERGDRRFDVRLISDSMTIRRLPQLWLQVTELTHIAGVSGLAILARPSGCDFFSLAAGFHHMINTPPAFPPEVIVRGADDSAEKTLVLLAAPLAAILSDPAIKEVGLTGQGFRIIRQADEGRRGDYLLLRQAAFAGVPVSVSQLAQAFDGIDALREHLVPERRERFCA